MRTITKQDDFDLHWKPRIPDLRWKIFAILSLGIALFIVYSNSFHGEWHFDDYANIVENPDIKIKSFSWPEIKHFIPGFNKGRLQPRPLSYLSFALNHKFGGMDVFGFHVVNFIIHYLVAVFLFLFIYNALKLPLLKDRYGHITYSVALLSTFFWALNPVHVTSVTYIVQRMTSLAGMFYIMSMYFYLKARTTAKTGSSVGFFIGCTVAGLAAFFSKQNAAMLPVSIILFDLILIQGVNKENIKKFGKFFLLPCLLFLIIGFIYVTAFSNVFSAYEVRDFSMTQRLLTEPRVILFYLSLLFYPISSRLTLLYDINISHSLFQPWTTIPSILLILFIIGFAFYIAGKRPLISFCIIFYFLNHLIEGSVLPLELIYEHRNYLPAMLLFVPLAEFIIYAINYFYYRKLIQLIVAAGIIIILVSQGDITYQRNNIISSELLLCMDNIKKYPNLSRPYTNLGIEYMRHNQRAEGLQYFKKALELNNFSNINACALQEHNLGIYYFYEGEYDLARPYFERAYKTIPFYVPDAVYIAKISLLKNDISRAHRLIEPLIKKNPDNSALNEIFCLILFKENNYKDAEFYAKKFLRKDLSSTFPLPILAEIALKKGNIHAAISLWRLYQCSFPFDSSANLALIDLYSQINDYKLLDDELAKLAYFKQSQSLTTYINKNFRNKNLLIYIPDTEKIITIVKERKKTTPVYQNAK